MALFSKKENKKEEQKIEAPKKEKTAVKTAGKSFAYEAINKPHISEKASLLAENNQYVFEVPEQYTKPEIKKAIEGIYNVNVLSVNIVTVPPKKRRLGKTRGWRKQLTKEIVKIRKDQKIEIL
jgi:large subunit ribosomal protein L23